MKISFILMTLAALFALPARGQDSTIQSNDKSKYILTPKAPATPRINGAKIYGCHPGADFIFRIPATGDRPMTFAASNLPKGLSLDSKTGIITGRIKKAGTYDVILKAENALGSIERPFRIVAGEDLALTPPMGWNSWNCWGNSINQEKMLQAAHAMVEKGLVDYGWSYVNNDVGWQGIRGGKYNATQTNKNYPDFKGMIDEIHSLGLKMGLYSAPWVGTYTGHIGSYCDNADGTYDWIKEGKVNEVYRIPVYKLEKLTHHFGKYSFVNADAKQWAEWGVDYLKYDWNPNDVYHTKEMYDALRATGRDIVFSVTNACPFADVREVAKYSDCVRTSADTRDEWKNIYYVGFESQDKFAPYSGPSHWMDADMLVVGKVGWGANTHDTKLTADEQYSHITLWAVLSSPLFMGCDIANMDEFTLSLLTNSEVIDVDQDILGIPATRFSGNEKFAIYGKPLEDGYVAVALFNLDTVPQTLGFNALDFGLNETVTVRDLWRQKDIKQISGKEQFDVEVAPHGAVMYKLYPGNSKGTVGR